jgi:hypothetical protein
MEFIFIVSDHVLFHAFQLLLSNEDLKNQMRNVDQVNGHQCAKYGYENISDFEDDDLIVDEMGHA